jgi:hypothetical protein
VVRWHGLGYESAPVSQVMPTPCLIPLLFSRSALNKSDTPAFMVQSVLRGRLLGGGSQRVAQLACSFSVCRQAMLGLRSIKVRLVWLGPLGTGQSVYWQGCTFIGGARSHQFVLQLMKGHVPSASSTAKPAAMPRHAVRMLRAHWLAGTVCVCCSSGCVLSASRL